MPGKKDALPAATPKGRNGNCADGRANDQTTHLQYNNLPRFKQYRNNHQQYQRVVRRMMANAYLILREFPARLRFSYYVDRNGKLIPGAERRADG
jgi:hypothetical protein